MPLTITYGAGVKRPQGKRTILPVDDSPVHALATALRTMPNSDEGWWAPTTWAKDYRLAKAWAGSSGIAVDVDYETKDAVPPVELVEAVSEAATARYLPGSVFHLTPHGARVVFVFDGDCIDSEAHCTAARGAGALVAKALGELGLESYRVDVPLLEDLGRLFFVPNTRAKGVDRRADVLIMRENPYTPAELAAHAPPPAVRSDPGPTPTPTFSDASARWNAEHRGDWPRAGGDCPACGHAGCFGRMPDDDARWVCWSTDHREPGIQGASCYHGDALDLEAYQRHCKPADVLRADGYLGVRGQVLPLNRPATAEQPNARYICNNSYLSVVTILRKNIKDVLGEGGRLQLNSMTGRPELNGKPIADEEVSSIRAMMELRLSGGEDKNGHPIGLKVKSGDVQAACSQVAFENPYHPVQDYLRGLTWDGVERLDAVPEDLLGAERTPLNQALIRRFFISAVARAMEPGCKVDTILILVGHQGALKSTFFRVLSAPWFLDSPIDIHSKDAYQTLRTAWIAEWAELESLARARDATAVKAFITSAKDTYRPSFGRFAVDVQRSNVIVGTTNHEEFLTDETGNRRFWPMRVSQIDIEATRAQRDQLWAEARARYERGEPWWLAGDETAALEQRHEQHQVQDAWKAVVEGWATRRAVDFTTAEVLQEPLDKPKGQWARADEMRVARVLKQLGFKQVKAHGGVRKWSR